MSYSRWGSSKWYTFWSASSGNSKEDQRFQIMIDLGRSISFTYKELKEDRGYCVITVIDICKNPKEYKYLKNIIEGGEELEFEYEESGCEPDPATEEEIAELEVYMDQFIRDIEWEYGILGRLSNWLCKLPSPLSNLGYWLWIKTSPDRK